MRTKILTLGLICLFIFTHCKKNLPTSPDLPDTHLPTINYFTASPAEIDPEYSSILSWSVTGAETVEIDQGIGVVSPQGSIEVWPIESTSYTLTASVRHFEPETASVLVEVRTFVSLHISANLQLYCTPPRIVANWIKVSNTSEHGTSVGNIVLHIKLDDGVTHLTLLIIHPELGYSCLKWSYMNVHIDSHSWDVSESVCSTYPDGIPFSSWEAWLTWETGDCPQ